MYTFGGIIFVAEILVFVACVNRLSRLEMSPCPNEEQNPARFYGQFSSIGDNKFSVNGTLVIDRDIGFDSALEYDVEVSKCKMDTTHCEEQSSFPGTDLCVIFSESYPVYKTLITKGVPQLPCPLKAGSYDMSAGWLDTTFALELQITGWFWFTTYKAFEKKEGNSTRQLVFCQETKMSMFTVKSRQRNRPKQNK